MWTYLSPPKGFFTDAEKQQVAAVFEAILPGDDTTPGAKDADAAEYLNRLLAMPDETYYEIPGWRELYKNGLPALDAAATALFGAGMAALTLAQMTALLAGLRAGTLANFAPAKPVDQRVFFAAIRNHCIEGCFADPRWGGNKDGVMWGWYGYFEPAKNFQRAARG